MNQENDVKLQAIFRLLFENVDNITQLKQLSEPAWDSLATTTLIAAIESEFNILMNIDDMERMTSYGAVRLLMEAKGL